MNRLGVLLGVFVLATSWAIANIYWDSPATLPFKAAFERSMIVKVMPMELDPKTGEMHPAGHGSGIRVRPHAVLTCAHVASTGTVLIEYYDGSRELGRVVVVDKRADLAILSVEHPYGLIATLGSTLQVGETVIAIGFPGGIGWAVTAGIVSYADERGVISDVVINPGNSGGGLFNSKMQLVGVARAMMGPVQLGMYQGHSVFIPIYKIRAILNKYDRHAHKTL